MYIVKNALKCISRSKGRNILIGVIVLVIAVSACIGLSIRQAAESAKKETLNTMTVTGTISFDRQSMMNQIGSGGGGFDRSKFSSMMGSSSSLSLEEYQKYAGAESVKDFYYSMTSSLNGTEDFEPVSTEDGTQSSGSSSMGGFAGIMGSIKGLKGDFTVVGYSGENAMTAFLDGTASVTQGSTFGEGTAAYECIISEELAAFNNLSIGDTIKLSNPRNEEEIYELKITGFYTDSSSNESSLSFMGAIADPANKIYMSYPTLQAILDASEEVSDTETDENTGIIGMLTGTYVFADTQSYERFETEVRELGLDSSYTVSSPDISAYENSLTPLNTLSTMAGYFLIVILLIGAIILVVLNIFNVRERKYEIGVLTAMGMKKGKVGTLTVTIPSDLCFKATT